jgi:hypothetical protein
MGDKPSDYDLWFRDVESARSFAKRLEAQTRGQASVRHEMTADATGKLYDFEVCVNGGVWVNPDKEAQLRCVSELAATYVIAGTTYQVVFMTWGQPKDVINKFDFEHCRCAYDPKASLETRFSLGSRFFECCAARTVVYRAGIAMYPLGSMIRMGARQAKDWNVPDVEWVKVAWDTSKLDLSNPKVLRAQLRGVDVVVLDALVKKLEAMKSDDKITLDWFMDQLRELKLI